MILFQSPTYFYRERAHSRRKAERGKKRGREKPCVKSVSIENSSKDL